MQLCPISHYFGPLPPWIHLTLKTLSWNPTIKWIIITDQQYNGWIPGNVSFITMKLEDLAERVSKVTGLRFHPHNGYKVCDWRPVFGLALTDLIGKADCWGHFDLDCFYGRIDNFISSEILRSHDIISADNLMLCGPFTLHANNPQINNLFRSIENYQSLLDDPFVYGCEETQLHRAALAAGIRLNKRRIHRFSENCDWIRCDKDGIFDKDGNETMFIHFRAVKNQLTIAADPNAESWTLDHRVIQ